MKPSKLLFRACSPILTATLFLGVSSMLVLHPQPVYAQCTTRCPPSGGPVSGAIQNVAATPAADIQMPAAQPPPIANMIEYALVAFLIAIGQLVTV